MTATNNLKCVTYTDEHSVSHSSYEDLMIGVDHKILGCGAANLFVNDTVILTANKGKQRWAMVVQLTERIYDCDLWATHGGKRWDHNFKYVPLTTVFPITPEIKAAMKDLGLKYELNPNNLLNSRFCSSKMWPLLEDLFASKVFVKLE